MASAGKKRGTPSRTKRAGGVQQYFEVGKVGRVTGVKLTDTGVRDENGLEPIEGVFSSPASPPRKESSSSDARMQESSGPDVDATLASRKTPRLPPPRASTPRHTNIGSPIRMSTGRSKARRNSDAIEDNISPSRPKSQAPNRVLDFGGSEQVYSTVENSPFRAKHNLRRSTGGRRTGVFNSPSIDREGDKDAEAHDSGVGNSQDEIVVAGGGQDDDEPIVGMDDDYAGPGFADTEMQGDDEEAEADEASRAPTPEPRRRSQRKSGDSLNNSLVQQESGSKSSGRKRTRASLDAEQDQSADVSQVEASSSSRKKRRSSVQPEAAQDEDEQGTIDPALLAFDESNLQADGDDTAPAADEEPAPQAKRKGGPKKKQASKKTGPNGTAQSQDKQSSARPDNRGTSMGPTSNQVLRATTPAADAGAISRYGRRLLKPLQRWKGEREVFNRGEIEGIIRAEDAPEESKPTKRKKRSKRGARAIQDRDDSDAESVMPDEWEEELGVISGDIANYDPETQSGNPNDLLHEDLAYAASSLESSEVRGGSSFSFAKVLTTPFFGAGVIKMPPGGLKRTKNSRHHQLTFFVHHGKVMVEVNPPGHGATNQFAISKGGIWIVPRGNLYKITNESSSTEAVIFFCQGCEVGAVAGGADASE